MKRLTLILMFVLASVSARAEDSGWQYTATLSGWFAGLDTKVDTAFGPIETELSFGDVLDKLDLALFGSFEARNADWSVILDLIYADLGTQVSSPIGVSARIDTQLTLLSAYGAYRVVHSPSFSLDVGGGARWNNADLNINLQSSSVPPVSRAVSDSWLDALIAVRGRYNFSDNWYGTAFGDVGGFGIGESSSLTWQAYAGIGYRFNDVWSIQGGYRHLSIQRDFGARNVELDLSGPIIGVQATF